LLSRFSANVVALMIKAVPVTAALAAAAVITLDLLLNNNNVLFWFILGGRIELPELWLCGMLWLAGIAAAGVAVWRERGVDVA